MFIPLLVLSQEYESYHTFIRISPNEGRTDDWHVTQEMLETSNKLLLIKCLVLACFGSAVSSARRQLFWTQILARFVGPCLHYSFVWVTFCLCLLSLEGSKHNFRKDTSEEVAAAPQRATRAKRTSGRITGCERVSIQWRYNLLHITTSWTRVALVLFSVLKYYNPINIKCKWQLFLLGVNV